MGMQMKKLVQMTVLSLMMAVVPFTVAAATAESSQNNPVPLYTVHDFFGLQDAGQFSVTADGRSLLFLAPVRGVLNIFQRDIATGEETQLTFETGQSITNYFLKNTTLLYIQDTQGDEIYHLFRVNENGTVTNLTPFDNVRAVPMSMLENTYADDEILVAMNIEDPQFFNIYRLNIFTGEFESELDDAVEGIRMDNDGVIRVIMIMDGIYVHMLHRYTSEDEFELVSTNHIDEFAGVIAFDADNRYAYAISNIGRNTDALVRINPSTGEELEVIFVREDVDVSSAMFTQPGHLAQVSYITYRSRRHFFCDEFEAFYNAVSALIPGDYIISITSTCNDWNMTVVSTMSDVSRGSTFLVNLEENTVIELANRTRGINPAHMAEMRPVEYTARDGLTIPGYLTLPVGVEPVNLPVVVLVHGGPWLRDVWGWNSEVQFLANRGYAVFQPNFRGSTGFGREFLQAGYGQWGIAMQDDITDGVLWLIEQGIADPSRIAIYGASYGGYAALAGAAFTPDLYAAAISLVGVSNIFTLLESIPPWWESERELLYVRIGHPVRDIERLVATSPVFHADAITAPLFVAHGANDPRVSLEESVQIVEALEARGVDVEFFVAWDEGHGFTNFRNVMVFYNTMEAFLAEHIGGRVATPVVLTLH